MKNRSLAYIVVTAALLVSSCGKEFLDIKRNANQVVPSTVRDYLAIVQRDMMLVTPKDLAFLGADEYIIKSEEELIAASQYSPFHRTAALWEDDAYANDVNIADWHESYERIMYANLALDVEKIDPSPEDRNDWNRTRIAAKFYRALNFYNMAQLFCKVYRPETADQEMGLPLRLDYDVSVHYGRSTLQDVYDLVINDLRSAEEIGLPDVHNIYLPGLTAVRALLARVYLQMGRYEDAYLYANKVLDERPLLLDYNVISGNPNSVFTSYFNAYGVGNPSIIHYTTRTVGGIMSANRIINDPVIRSTYADDDLRAKLYFFMRTNGTSAYIGSYAGQGASVFFTGLTVDEMILIKAECLARFGQIGEAEKALIQLRKHRYKSDINYQVNMIKNEENILPVVLEERQKELFLRGLRWEDVRRLNRDDNAAISFQRVIQDNIYRLEAQSKKWVWPIPESEIRTSSLEQNDR